ncbi:hypothetical protein C2G38_2032110 [Gigaspora rosea]|uniref:Ubiquitin carboxyl-terminal hydrolase n=2 Tax=Gigasporaceae TaxID=36753 RepID=A0A397VQC9_9GLOM|nr:hypothetical protein C2G38_2032110 [Gigaspora rosea]CAG8500246.1 17585_t:CDS:10 [Gigaspora rosea]
MYSQKEYKPIYGSFTNREAIDTIITNTKILTPKKVPYTIGYPPLKRGGKRMASSKPQNCDTESQSIYYPEVSKIKNSSLMSQTSSTTTTIIPTASRSVDPVNTSITTPDLSTTTQSFTCNQSSNDSKNLITSPTNILNIHHPSSSGKNLRTTSELTISDDKSTSLPSSENSITISPQKEGNVPKNISSFNDGRNMRMISPNKSMQALDVPSESNIPKTHYSTDSNGFPTLANSGHSIKPTSNCNHSTIQINGQAIDEPPHNTSSVTNNNVNSNVNNNIVNTTTSGNSVKNGISVQDAGNQQLAKSTSNGTSSKRWADLFNKSDEAPTTTSSNIPKPTIVKPPNSSSKQEKPATPLPNGKPVVGGLAGVLSSFELSLQRAAIQPRGLVNNGNMCFMNAILQTLSHCPPFYNLLARIKKEVTHSFKGKTPLVDSLVMFINEYRQTNDSETEAFGEPILPDYVYDALRGLKRFDSMKGRQEDAEEFLGFLLDGLHEEFLTVFRPGGESQGVRNKQSVNGNNDLAEKSGPNKDDGNENTWMEVGPKNKTSYTRTTDIEESPISRIFGGQLRSVLQCPGSMDSITLEPFQSLQLDIQPDDVKTVGDALKNLTNPEYVDDFYSAKKDLVRATKRLYIETLPPILTLHLKRFVYDNVGGTQKLSKHIGYSTTLSIQQELMAPSQRVGKVIEYQLFGVVYHHGKSATGGHYTADILRYDDEWLHVDDTTITQISAEEVAILENPTQPTDRSAYILFYMRRN